MPTPKRNVIRVAVSLLLTVSSGFLAAHPVHAETGVTETEIRLGQSGPLSGPTSAKYIESKNGAELYFNKINAAGGVYGRKIRLLVYDDGYEPERAAENTRKLIKNDGVFALFQYYGTPTSKASMPLVNSSHVPFIAPQLGAEFLRNPVNPLIYNVHVGYMDEGRTMVDFIVGKKGIRNFALLFQDDAFGNEGRAAAYKAFLKYGVKPAIELTYHRNQTDMSEIVTKLKAAKVGAVLAWAQAPQALGLAKGVWEQKLDAILVSASALATAEFAGKIREYPVDYYTTSALPLLDDNSSELVRQYLADAKAAGQPPMNGAFEGYLNAIVLIEGLKRTGKELTRESFLRAMESISKLELGGVRIGYSKDDHRGLQEAFMVSLKDGRLARVKE